MKPKRKGRILPNDPLMIQVIIFILIAIVALVLQSRWVAKNQEKFLGSLMVFMHVERIPCEHCDKTGLVQIKSDPPQMDICPVCFGLGGHNVRKYDDRENLCPACAGMGRIFDEETGTARTCRRCDGRGLIRTESAPAEEPGDKPQPQ